MTTQSPTQLPLLTEAPGWQALGAHHRDIGAQSLRQLFDQDPERGHRLAAVALVIYFDYSTNRVTVETLQLLFSLAPQRGLEQKIAALFASAKLTANFGKASFRVIFCPFCLISLFPFSFKTK